MVYAQNKLLGQKFIQTHITKEIGKSSFEKQSIFVSDRYIGSVSRLKNTLIVNIITNKFQYDKQKTFYPSHYTLDLTDPSEDGKLQPVTLTLRILESKYGMLIPNKDSIRNIITVTEGDSIPGTNLVKVLRPSIYYTDLNTRFRHRSQYYHCDTPFDLNVDEYDLNYVKFNLMYKLKQECIRYRSSFDKIRNCDLQLNRLYFNIFRERSEYMHMDIVFDPIEPVINEHKEFFYRYKGIGIGIKDMIFFREDDFLIFSSFKASAFVNMFETRQKLLSKMDELGVNANYYAICANSVGMEFLSIENPYVNIHPGDIPLIYSIIDTENTITNKYITNGICKQTYNILNKIDGDSLLRMLGLR